MYFYSVSKDDLIKDLSHKNKHLIAKNSSLEHENKLLREALYGKKTERFIPDPLADNQASLFESDEEKNQPDTEPQTEQITYERKKKKHPGRNIIPENLPTREVVIEPNEDTTGMVKIGEEVSITLEYTPASLVKVITRRPKYSLPDDSGVLIAPLPERPINKGIAEASLLAHIIVCKFIDHLPFYRQIQRFKRDYDWHLPSSTINDWFVACCTLLEPLYELMKQKALQTDYLQADESPIQVQDSEKKGATHRGYQWVYRDALSGIIIFQYRKGRGMHGPKEMLKDYQGYLQTDGYKVYDKIGKKPGINLVGCWAHSRRKFYEAKSSNKALAQQALNIYQTIYLHDRKAKAIETIEQRKNYREQHIKPIMLQLKSWVEEHQHKTLPKSPIGKAITYVLLQWPKLRAVLDDGRLEIDNNLIENKIRPLALGRKNYLFAGSHQAAQRIAMMYSFFATCKAKQVNPYDWLKTTLEKIPSTKLSELDQLIPGYQQQV